MASYFRRKSSVIDVCQGPRYASVLHRYFYTIYDALDCRCSEEGSLSGQCTFSGACECKPMNTGNRCNKCIEG